jgi:hypothetical protein
LWASHEAHTNMSSSRGDGTIPLEVGTVKVDTFAQDLFRRTPQNLSYTKRTIELVLNEQSLNPPSQANFRVPGKQANLQKWHYFTTCSLHSLCKLRILLGQDPIRTSFAVNWCCYTNNPSWWGNARWVKSTFYIH